MSSPFADSGQHGSIAEAQFCVQALAAGKNQHWAAH